MTNVALADRTTVPLKKVDLDQTSGRTPFEVEMLSRLAAIESKLEALAGTPVVSGLIGKPEMQRLLDIEESTLDRRRNLGDIGPTECKVGVQIKWHLAEVEAWLKHRQRDGNLHTAETWPAVWASLNKTKK